MAVFPLLTALNCFLIVLHSHPLGLICDLKKKFESRPRKSSRKYIVLVSALKDNSKLGWPSDPGIKPGYIYAVAKIADCLQGTYSKWDWVLDPLIVLTSPIAMGAPVGRCGGGHVTPRLEHMHALDTLNSTLRGVHITASKLQDMPGAGENNHKPHVLSTPSWEYCGKSQEVRCEKTNRIIPLS